MVRHPSVVRGPTLSTLSNLNISETSLPILDQILYVASQGWGKGCIRFWGRSDQNPGFCGNRKSPLTYNGENDVSTVSWWGYLPLNDENFTLLNLNISEASWPVLINFYV